ncbi:unnamed protein product [Victoria cruziana]
MRLYRRGGPSTASPESSILAISKQRLEFSTFSRTLSNFRIIVDRRDEKSMPTSRPPIALGTAEKHAKIKATTLQPPDLGEAQAENCNQNSSREYLKVNGKTS